MTYRIALSLVAASTLAVASAAAQTDTPSDRPAPMKAALSAFVSEALYCTAYFGFAQEVVNRQAGGNAPRAQKLAERLGQLSGAALNLAITTGHRLELTPDQLAAQQSSVFADVKKTTNNSAGALPQMIARYDKPCKALIKEPEVRVQALFRKAFE